MSKSLLLDFKTLKEQGLSIEEFLFLYSRYKKEIININTEVVDISKLESNLFIKSKEKLELRQKSIDLIKFLEVETSNSFKDNKKIIKKSKRVINSLVEDNIHLYRDKWKGLKPGSMGGLQSCKEKLTRWITENPEYSFDDILNAADLYLNTEGRNTKYLQRADYFIFKKDGKEESSRLSAFIDDLDGGDDEDWTSNLN